MVHTWTSYLRSVAGETIPIRLFLGGFDLTPTFRDVNKKFNTRYYLNLVLVDEENRRYYKQNEITIFRIPDVRHALYLRSSDSLSALTELSAGAFCTFYHYISRDLPVTFTRNNVAFILILSTDGRAMFTSFTLAWWYILVRTKQ